LHFYFCILKGFVWSLDFGIWTLSKRDCHAPLAITLLLVFARLTSSAEAISLTKKKEGGSFTLPPPFESLSVPAGAKSGDFYIIAGAGKSANNSVNLSNSSATEREHHAIVKLARIPGGTCYVAKRREARAGYVVQQAPYIKGQA
jgi:hypothetical protein